MRRSYASSQKSLGASEKQGVGRKEYWTGVDESYTILFHSQHS